MCEVCGPDKFSPDESATQICSPCLSCVDGEEEERGCNSYTDRVCKPKGKCRPSDLWWAPGHCRIISKYGPSLSKTVGPVDPSYLVVKKSQNCTKEKVHVGCQYIKTCLKQPLKKRRDMDLNNKCS